MTADQCNPSVSLSSNPETSGHLLEVRGRLDLPDRLHEGVPHDDADVGAGVAVRLVSELAQVGVAQAVRGVAQVEAEHLGPRRLLRQGDVDALLESETQHVHVDQSQAHCCCCDTHSPGVTPWYQIRPGDSGGQLSTADFENV